jgi:hypothetical protein
MSQVDRWRPDIETWLDRKTPVQRMWSSREAILMHPIS